MIRLETKTKYYIIDLITDLLGDLVVVCFYGSLKSNLNHTKTYFVADKLKAMELIQKIVKVRYKHQYEIITDSEEWV